MKKSQKNILSNIKELIEKYPILREGFFYGIIGITTSTIDSLTFFVLRTVKVNLFLSNFIGVNVGILLSFLLNTFLNFKQTDHLLKKALSFFSVGYIGLCISMFIMWLFVEEFHWREFWVKIASIIIVAIIQFILNKLITYRKKDKMKTNVKVNVRRKKSKKLNDNLYIVIPAYNEEDNIERVAREWHKVVETIGNNSKLVIINDGSKDDTYKKLCSLKKELPCLEPINKPNEGHGATVLYGYHYALKKNASYIFQTDSDGQTIPEEFYQFWEQRKDYDAIIGHRNHRQDGISRIFVTKTLKTVLFVIFGLKITDANTPFRLISYDILKKYYPRIPEKFNLSNVMLTVLLIDGHERVKFVPITFRPRQGGENSINFKKIIKIGKQAVNDFIRIKKEMKGYKKHERMD